MSVATKDPIRAASRADNDHRLVMSLPVRRQPAFTDNIDEEFFKLDEEEEEQKRRPIDYYTDDIPELDEDDQFQTTQEDDLLEEDSSTPRAQSKSERGGTFVPSSMPIEIARATNHQVKMNGVERLVPLKKLEQQLDHENNEEREKTLESREQAMFRNMQRLSFSVQPEDGPERLWGDHSDWEDERRRRRCSFNQHHYDGDGPTPQRPHQAAPPQPKLATTAPGPVVHTPREPNVFRPSHNAPSALIKMPGAVKRPVAQIPSQPFAAQPAPAPRSVEPRPHARAQLPGGGVVTAADRPDHESRGRTHTVDGVQRQPKM